MILFQLNYCLLRGVFVCLRNSSIQLFFFCRRKRFISPFALPIPPDYLVQKNLKENAGGKNKKTGHMDTVCWDKTEGLQHIFIYGV